MTPHQNASRHHQVAFITGGGRGLGAATAMLLAEKGIKVAITARTTSEVEQIENSLRQRGFDAVGLTLDVSDWDQVQNAVAQVGAMLGDISIVVNNAATTSPFTRTAEADPIEWAYAIEVNLIGAFNCVRATLPRMLSNGWGRIINVTSGAAVHPISAASAYNASKAGLDHFTRSLSMELQDSGVVAIGISPGIMDTAMQSSIRSAPIAEADRFREFHSQGLLRSPAEVARIIQWLCGEDGAGYQGQIVNAYNDDIRAQLQLPLLQRHSR